MKEAIPLDGLDRHYMAVALATEIRNCWKHRHFSRVLRDNIHNYVRVLRKIRASYGHL